MCSQWQPRWRGQCQAYFGPGHWTGKLSLAPSRAPPSSRGLQARVWKPSHVDLNAPSLACSGVRMRGEQTDRRNNRSVQCLDNRLMTEKKQTSIKQNIKLAHYIIICCATLLHPPLIKHYITVNEVHLPWITDCSFSPQCLMVISPCCAQLCILLRPYIQRHNNTLSTKSEERLPLDLKYVTRNIFVMQHIIFKD